MEFYDYWGKSRKSAYSSGANYHLAALHCLDAVAVAEAWLEMDPALAKVWARSSNEKWSSVRQWILFFIAMHDLGKFDIRFQRKDLTTAMSLNKVFATKCHGPSYGHGEGGYSRFCEEVESYGLPRDVSTLWMKSAASHHGNVVVGGGRKPLVAKDVRLYDQQARIKWVHALDELLLASHGVSLSAGPPAEPPMFRGFCCICDWLASNETFFDFVDQPPDRLDAYLADRQSNAEEALSPSGMLHVPVQCSGFAGLYSKLRPRGVQQLVDQWSHRAGLTLIEAPTGSGKTEAALAHASSLIREGVADGVIFALPTQATANAMLARLEVVAERMFCCERSTNIVLAHGKARRHPLQKKLIQNAEGMAYANDAAVQCSQWLAQSRKRAFLGQIGVCTVDQVLMSVLPFRHNFVRQFGLGRSVLIIDEVHAYDSYVNGLLDEVLSRQCAVGGSAILLSATLPASRRRCLLETYGCGNGHDDTAYPLVSLACNGSFETQSVDLEDSDARQMAFRIVNLDIDPIPADLPDELVEEIANRVAAGKRIAVVCNLIDHAQHYARQLSQRLPGQVDLFHSRYRFVDRQRIEEWVIKSYGCDRDRNAFADGRVLVATQVVEQSLDLDFDWMITHLCPVDLLFQRVGRLHRKHIAGRAEPAECVVLSPPGVEFGLHSYIYSDTRLLWRTRELVKAEPLAQFPQVYRRWIESVYDEAARPDEPAVLLEEHETYVHEQAQRHHTALQLVHGGMAAFGDNSPETSWSLTRGSQMGIGVLPFIETDGQKHTLDGDGPLTLADSADWGETEDLQSVPVPSSWKWNMGGRHTHGGVYLPMVVSDDGGWVCENDHMIIRYSLKYGLERTTTESRQG